MEAVLSISYNYSISPPVYVVYRNVSATAGCTNIGNTYASVTIFYEQNELRTWPPAGTLQVFNFADLYSNCTTRTASPLATEPPCFLSQGQGTWPAPADSSCISYVEKIQSDEASESEHCYPQLEYPYKVRALNPEWANCESASEDRYWGVYDPPRALVSANAMAPKPTQDPNIRLSAAPASPILPSWPPVTSSPGGITPPQPSDPAVANPGNPPPDQNQNGNTPVSKSPTQVDPSAQDSGSGIHSGPKPQSLSNDQVTDSSVQGESESGSTGSNAGVGSQQGSDDPNDDSQRLPDPSPSVDSGPTPTIKWAGFTVQPGESSQYTIPNIGVLIPGGPAAAWSTL